MKFIYECEYCKKQFTDRDACVVHECGHLHGVEAIKYYITNILHKCPCKYCNHVYYVYGCEEDCRYPYCTYSNNYENFTPGQAVWEDLGIDKGGDENDF